MIKKHILTLTVLATTSLVATTPINTKKIAGNTGGISFTVEFEKKLENGANSKNQKFTLFSIKNFARAIMSSSKSETAFTWRWNQKKATGIRLLLPEFNAKTPYNILLTWDASKGIFDCYINGYPARLPGTQVRPWQPLTSGKLEYGHGPFNITNLKFYSQYLTKEHVATLSPEQKQNPLLSCSLSKITFEQLESMRGKLLYNGPKVDPGFNTWIQEGPVKHYEKDDWAVFESTMPKKRKHIVWWNPVKFPESFIADWDIKVISDYGLCIVFFAAQGKDGQSIFDKSLPKRDGTFTDYTKGAIKSYHISYLTNAAHNPGRPQVNLRKNNSFYLMAQGGQGIPADKNIHKVTLCKDKSRIIMAVDGRIIMDYTDTNPERYGKAYKSGWIGLRQMSWAICGYHNFTVWEIKK